MNFTRTLLLLLVAAISELAISTRVESRTTGTSTYEYLDLPCDWQFDRYMIECYGKTSRNKQAESHCKDMMKRMVVDECLIDDREFWLMHRVQFRHWDVRNSCDKLSKLPAWADPNARTVPMCEL